MDVERWLRGYELQRTAYFKIKVSSFQDTTLPVLEKDVNHLSVYHW